MRDGWRQETRFTRSVPDRRLHAHAIGESGTEKTTLLRNLILQDIESGRLAGFPRPHKVTGFEA